MSLSSDAQSYLSKRTEALTREMVRIPSINGASGEIQIARWLYEHLAGLPRIEPERLPAASAAGAVDAGQQADAYRFSVAAYLPRPEAPEPAATAVLLSHFDTVGVDDYGDLREDAFRPDILRDHLQAGEFPPGLADDREFREDAGSQHWLCGRGILDMKSGLAVHLALLEWYAEHPETLPVNLVLLAVCDEEDGSRGALSSLPYLLDLRQEEHLAYQLVIDADYTSPREAGDTDGYIYAGTIGKLLPASYVVGQPTHVGEPTGGIDPNHITAEIVRELELNIQYADRAAGETTPPPMCLKQMDFKDVYTVQTPLDAYTYFNYFTLSQPPDEVLDRMKGAAARAVARVEKRRHQAAAARTDTSPRSGGAPPGPPDESVEPVTSVYTYDELYKRLAQEKGESFTGDMADAARQFAADKSLDARMFSAAMAAKVAAWARDRQPLVVVMVASLYSPRIHLDGSDPRHDPVLQALDEAAGALNQVISETAASGDAGPPLLPGDGRIRRRYFYPYISDLSFFGSSDSQASLEILRANSPAWGWKYDHDVALSRRLDIPVVNIGPWGKGAHTPGERLYAPYAFEVLPRLTAAVLQRLG